MTSEERRAAAKCMVCGDHTEVMHIADMRGTRWTCDDCFQAARREYDRHNTAHCKVCQAAFAGVEIQEPHIFTPVPECTVEPRCSCFGGDRLPPLMSQA